MERLVTLPIERTIDETLVIARDLAENLIDLRQAARPTA
jgi:hypothetical protein